MPTSRARGAAEIRRDIESAEQRLIDLVERWRSSATTAALTDVETTRETFDRVEETLRFQRGTIERLHQLWIEYAQAVGHHAPQ
jgi:hypothetical protein